MRTISECTIDGCVASTGMPGTARGLCNKHYTRAQRYGDPLHTKAYRGGSLEGHFDFYSTHRPDGDECWIWQGYFSPRGYGVIHWRGRTIQAHRFSLESAVGPLKDGELARHKCDNPPCVNPQHLEPGTQQDNMDDMWRRGRGSPPKGARNSNSKLTVSDASLIRDLLGQGVYSQSFLARLFGVTSQAVWAIAANKTWRYVPMSYANASSRGEAA